MTTATIVIKAPCRVSAELEAKYRNINARATSFNQDFGHAVLTAYDWPEHALHDWLGEEDSNMMHFTLHDGDK